MGPLTRTMGEWATPTDPSGGLGNPLPTDPHNGSVGGFPGPHSGSVGGPPVPSQHRRAGRTGKPPKTLGGGETPSTKGRSSKRGKGPEALLLSPLCLWTVFIYPFLPRWPLERQLCPSAFAPGPSPSDHSFQWVPSDSGALHLLGQRSGSPVGQDPTAPENPPARLRRKGGGFGRVTNAPAPAAPLPPTPFRLRPSPQNPRCPSGLRVAQRKPLGPFSENPALRALWGNFAETPHRRKGFRRRPPPPRKPLSAESALRDFYPPKENLGAVAKTRRAVSSPYPDSSPRNGLAPPPPSPRRVPL